MNSRHLGISALALMLATACGDATGLEPADLQGTWVANSMVFTSTADPTLTVDLIAEGATLELQLAADGMFLWTLTELGSAPATNTGAYLAVGTTLTLAGVGSPVQFTITRDGNNMTLTANDEYDFDEDSVDEAASLRITLTR